MQIKEYIIRVEGQADTYGLGEIIAPRIALFKDGHYNLSKDQLEVAIKKLGKAHILNEQP